MNMPADSSQTENEKSQDVNTTPPAEPAMEGQPAQTDATASIDAEASTDAERRAFRHQEASPYVGPRSFRTGEKIYGRERETTTLQDLIIAERIVLLYSPSGAGKSSLINAALLPSLKEQNFTILPIIRVSQEVPNDAVGISGLNRYVLSALLSLEEGIPAEKRLPLLRLASMNLTSYLELRCAQATEAGQDMSAILLVLDQFEEIITLDPTDRDAKMEFFLQLGQALRDRSRWALFAMREDFVAALDPYLRPIPTRLATRFRLDLLEVEGAMQAICEPARAAGVEFLDNAARKLVDDLRTVQVQQADGSLENVLGLYVEPVQLQVVCSNLWLKLPQDDNEISIEDVEKLGDTNQALGDYYDSQVDAVVLKTGIRERAARKWFDTKMITIQGIRGQVPKGRGETEGLSNEAVTAFERAYLIRADNRAGTTWYELAHDRLIQPIRESNARWFDKHLVLFQRQAEVWKDQGKPDGMLLTGQALVDAETWAKAHTQTMTGTEREFLDKALQSREASLREQRANLRIKRLGIAAMVIGVIAVIVGIIAGINYFRAEEQKTLASAREISFVSINHLGIDPDRSMLLALAAIETTGGPDKAVPSALEALHRSFQSIREERILSGHSDRVYGVAYSPQKALLATGSLDGTARIWNTDSGKPIRELKPTPQTFVTDVAFSADGQWLATSQGDGSVCVWDVSNGSLVARFDSGSESWSVDFTPVKDGPQLLVSAHLDGKARVWSMDTKSLVKELDTREMNPEIRGLEAVTFSHDGKRVGAGSDNGKAYIWDIETGQEQLKLEGHSDVVNSIDFSPDGKLIATGSADRGIRIWNAVDGKQLALIEGHLDWVFHVVFTADSQTLISSSSDRTIRLWNVAKGIETMRLVGHADQIYDVAVSPDKVHIASSSQDKTARIWNISQAGTHELFTFVPANRVYSMGRSPDGKDLALGLREKNIEIWDANPNSTRARLTLEEETPSKDSAVEGLEYTTDGRYLASTGRDGQVILWDVQAGYKKVWASRKEGVIFWDLAYDPASSGRILTGGSDGALYIWNEADGKLLKWLPKPDDVSPGAGSSIYAVEVYPKDPNIAAAGYKDGSIVLWDLAAGKPLVKLLQQHSEIVQALAFSPDGKMMASVAEDAKVYIYDLDLANKRVKARPAMVNHAGALFAVAFSPDSQQLATGGADLITRLWDTSTGEEKLALYGPTDRIYSIQFSPDGSSVYTASRDRSIRGYILDPVKLAALARSRLNRDLIDQECKVYLHLDACPKK